MQFIPARLIVTISNLLGGEKMKFMQQITDLARALAGKLVEEKKAAQEQGVIGKDILSLCVRSNAGQDFRGKMSEDEMLSQLQCV